MLPWNLSFCAGYGGFGISTTPYFNPTVLAFLQAYGAILAVVNIRGGGEFGREWHRAGIRENKASPLIFLSGQAVILF
jgi:prolyl oligopeptidase